MDYCSLEKLGIKDEDIFGRISQTSRKSTLGGAMPEIISFCFNPGPNLNIKYNEYISNPAEAKAGIRMKKCKEYGMKRFSLHTIIETGSLNVKDLAETQCSEDVHKGGGNQERDMQELVLSL